MAKKHPKSQKNKDHIFKDGKIDIAVKQGQLDLSARISSLYSKINIIRRLFIVQVFEILISITAVLFLVCHFNYIFLENKSHWNDYLNNISIGALTQDSLEAKLNQIYDTYLDKKNTFLVDGNIYAINGRDLGIKFDIRRSVEEILADNKTSYKNKVIDRLESINKDRTFHPIVFVDTQILKNTMERLIPELQNTASDPKIVVRDNKLEIIPSYSGVTTDYKNIVDKLYQNASNLTASNINISIKNYDPDFDDQYVQNVLNEAVKIYSNVFYLSSELIDQKYTLNINDNYKLLRFTKIINPITEKKELIADINPIELKYYLENIATEINRERQNTTLTVNENLEIQAEGINEDGYELDIPNTIEEIYSRMVLADMYDPDVNLLINIDQAKIIQPHEFDTDIKELIAFGESDFAGSPKNRKQNILVASKKFQNIIIQPDEEISFNKILGPVTGEEGYQKELVIKEGGSQTIPEYGGGVCQVSTTLYRSALYAGLDITQRRSHSYKVVYYNPDGLDATIYPPNVDLKIKNTYPFPILVQNKLDLDNATLVFYIYGTNVGRKVEMDGPYRYAYKEKPDPVTEYVPSKPEWWSEFKKGHVGFNTYWTRKIFMENGEEKEETIYSYYKAIPDKKQLGGNEPIPEPKIVNLDNPEETSI